MSRWVIAAGLLGLLAGWASGQSTSRPLADAPVYVAQDSPFGLPPPFKPPEEDKKANAPAEPKADAKKPETAVEKAELPPEEDKSDEPKTFTFNPVESKKMVVVGDQYLKKGNYVAAISRFDEATKWNDGNADAWLHLGEAQEKKGNVKAARTAYEKYLDLQPDAKNAKDVKARLAKLKN